MRRQAVAWRFSRIFHIRHPVLLAAAIKTLSVPPGAGQVRQTATRLLLFAGCPPPPASWLPAGKASGVLRRDLERPTGDAVRGDGDGTRSLSASLNGRWNEAEPDSRQAPPARPGMALHRRGAVAGHAGGRQSLRPLRGAQLCRRRKPLVEGPEGCHLLPHPLCRLTRRRRLPPLRGHRDPLGDREMRLALDQPDPDIEAARQGILRAATMPTTLPRSSGCTATSTTSVTSSAPSGWLVGDKYVMELIDVAGKMRAGIGAGQASAEQVQQWKTEIHAINEKVTPAAKAFSDALGGLAGLARAAAGGQPDHRQRAHPPGVPADPAATDAAPGSGERPDAERERAQITLASIGDG